MRVLRRLRPDRRGWCGKLLLPVADPRRVFAGSERREGMLVEEVRAARAEIADAGSLLEAQIAAGRRKLARLEAQVQKNALGDPDRHSRPLQRTGGARAGNPGVHDRPPAGARRGIEPGGAAPGIGERRDAGAAGDLGGARDHDGRAGAGGTCVRRTSDRPDHLRGRRRSFRAAALRSPRLHGRRSGAAARSPRRYLQPPRTQRATCGAASKRCGRRCGRSIRSICPDPGCCDARPRFPGPVRPRRDECLSSTRCARSPSRSRST